MKAFTKVIMVTSILVGLIGLSGCSGKTLTTQAYNPGVQGMMHATNFGGIRKICVDDVMYITSYNGMTPAIDNKNGLYIHCHIDEYGRVIALENFKGK